VAQEESGYSPAGNSSGVPSSGDGERIRHAYRWTLVAFVLVITLAAALGALFFAALTWGLVHSLRSS
jgi:hypothetical protein